MFERDSTVSCLVIAGEYHHHGERDRHPERQHSDHPANTHVRPLAASPAPRQGGTIEYSRLRVADAPADAAAERRCAAQNARLAARLRASFAPLLMPSPKLQMHTCFPLPSFPLQRLLKVCCQCRPSSFSSCLMMPSTLIIAFAGYCAGIGLWQIIGRERSTDTGSWQPFWQ